MTLHSNRCRIRMSFDICPLFGTTHRSNARPMYLSDLSQSKDNNFNFIRIVAALTVLISHSFPLTTGSAESEPVKAYLGMSMGTMAVDIFFITSGFLVTGSLFNRQSAIDFSWARTLRIFPALVVMLLFTVFGIGLCFTTIPAAAYLADPQTYIYLVKCATLITGIENDLPGVFRDNPYRHSVNGSLWSMPYEIKMYAILAAIWIAAQWKEQGRTRLFRLAIVSAACIACLSVLWFHFHGRGSALFSRLFFMFFSGAAYYVLRERIKLSPAVFAVFSITLLLSAAVDRHLFFVVYVLTAAYVLLYLAHIPSGGVRLYNKLGDYSYGVYIYAFPVQQSVAALFPGISVPFMMLISAAVTLLLSILSWNLVEKHALTLKEAYIAHTRKIFSNRMATASAEV